MVDKYDSPNDDPACISCVSYWNPVEWKSVCNVIERGYTSS